VIWLSIRGTKDAAGAYSAITNRRIQWIVGTLLEIVPDPSPMGRFGSSSWGARDLLWTASFIQGGTGEKQMGIETIVANISCSNLEVSLPWYQRLFGVPPTRRPMAGLAEWHFTDSAEVQLYENKANAGKSTLTIGVLPLEPEHLRLSEHGLEPGPIESTDNFFIMRINDPDGNLVVMVSARRS
jgi:hypothetical protein